MKIDYFGATQEIHTSQKTVDLPSSEDMGVLAEPLTVDGTTIPNRLVVQPMEGCDGTPNGQPDELTRRRYMRFAGSGAGLIWVEATAVVLEGRANPRQLMLSEQTLDSFKALNEEIREISLRQNGFNPAIVLQLTHSGRYSKPEGKPAPIIARNNPIFETQGALDESCIAGDGYFDSLPERYAKAAKLAGHAGFDGVDVKACHGYLLNETFSAYTRPGKYGGSFENRTRLFRECIKAVKSVFGGLLTTRLSLYDGFSHPYGWGVDENGNPAPEEVFKLIEWLKDSVGITLINATAGNPYVNPHVNRPYEKGAYVPPESPLEGVDRLCRCTAQIKKRFSDMVVIASGLSYMRGDGASLAAGLIKSGMADMAGFGRLAFADPEFAKNMIAGKSYEKNCCIACSKCSELMRAGGTAGCVVRDGAVYASIYKKFVMGMA